MWVWRACDAVSTHGLLERCTGFPRKVFAATSGGPMCNTPCRRGCLLQECSGRVALLLRLLLQDRPYLCNMAVAPERRGRGYGTLLMRAAEELVTYMGERELYLHVRWAVSGPHVWGGGGGG